MQLDVFPEFEEGLRSSTPKPTVNSKPDYYAICFDEKDSLGRYPIHSSYYPNKEAAQTELSKMPRRTHDKYRFIILPYRMHNICDEGWIRPDAH